MLTHVAFFLAQFVPFSPVPCQALTYHEAPSYAAHSETWYTAVSNPNLDGYWSGSQACVDRRVIEDAAPCGDLLTQRALYETRADVMDVCDPMNTEDR